MKLSIATRRGRSAFTIAEIIVATGIGAMVLAAAFAFLNGMGRAWSGVYSQNVMNQQAGNAIEFIQSRIRFATSITNNNDSTGNTLMLGFDDNYAVDSSGDGIAYNDQDHYEMFKFSGVNSTNALLCVSNKLLYYTNKNSTSYRTLITGGMRNLPGNTIFSVTNKVMAVIRFGIADNYTRDYYQSIDIQATGVSLNRPVLTNIISLLP